MLTGETLLSVLLAACLSLIVGLIACFLLSADWRIKPLRDMYERLYKKKDEIGLDVYLLLFSTLIRDYMLFLVKNSI